VKAADEPKPGFPATGVDALPPPAMAGRAEEVGIAKAGLDSASTFALAVLAGAFIAMGAVFATVATAGGDLPYGIGRLVGGVTFALGLILVVVAGAELFTGNNLIVMAWASRRITTIRLLRNWTIVYAGNFVGAIATAALVFASRQYRFGDGAVGQQALAVASAKTGLGFGQAVALGILCNALVCIAVWLTYSARSVTDKILAVIPPIAAFVAAGFEHSVANMYFIPAGLLIQTDEAFAASVAEAQGGGNLGWGSFVVDNLIPVTIGNVVGGTVLVAALYWFVYLRPGRRA
jgi:formate/nitrite transporter